MRPGAFVVPGAIPDTVRRPAWVRTRDAEAIETARLLGPPSEIAELPAGARAVPHLRRLLDQYASRDVVVVADDHTRALLIEDLSSAAPAPGDLAQPVVTVAMRVPRRGAIFSLGGFAIAVVALLAVETLLEALSGGRLNGWTFLAAGAVALALATVPRFRPLAWAGLGTAATAFVAWLVLLVADYKAPF